MPITLSLSLSLICDPPNKCLSLTSICVVLLVCNIFKELMDVLADACSLSASSVHGRRIFCKKSNKLNKGDEDMHAFW